MYKIDTTEMKINKTYSQNKGPLEKRIKNLVHHVEEREKEMRCRCEKDDPSVPLLSLDEMCRRQKRSNKFSIIESCTANSPTTALCWIGSRLIVA